MKTERERETRRKILLGALILNDLRKGRNAEEKQYLTDYLRRRVPAFIGRPEDKDLFAEMLGVENGRAPIKRS